MLKRALFILACGLTFATAQAAPERPGALFDNADANGDGVVTLDEFKAARAAAFGQRDRNGDGCIDDADLGKRAARRPRARAAAEHMRSQLDLDHDGKITQQEFVDGAIPLFTRADANGDGAIDAHERDAARAAMKEHIQQLREQQG